MRLVFFIIILLSVINTSAQTNLLTVESFYDWNGESFDKLPCKEITYEYDTNGALIQEVEFVNIDSIPGLDTSKVTTYYPGTALVKSLLEVSSYLPKCLTEYEYGSNSCLLSEQKYWYITSDQVWFNYQNIYYNPATCLLDYEVYYYDVTRYYTYEYVNDTVKSYIYYHSLDSLSYNNGYSVYGDSNELLLSIYISDLIDKYEYSYNDYGDLERKAYSYNGGVNNSFKLSDEILYTYDYGMDGEKYSEIETQIYYYYSGESDVFTYTHYFEFPLEETFYCDGLLKSTLYQIKKEGVYENSTLKKYAYAFGKNCPEPDIVLGVFPNPTTGRLHIQSEILEQSATELEVFTASGVKVLSKEIPERTAMLELDLSAFNQGIYILHLTSNDISISRKIQVIE